MAKLVVEGQEKEIKFINVNQKDNRVSIFFTDFTGMALEDVKILIEAGEEDDEL